MLIRGQAGRFTMRPRSVAGRTVLKNYHCAPFKRNQIAGQLTENALKHRTAVWVISYSDPCISARQQYQSSVSLTIEAIIQLIDDPQRTKESSRGSSTQEERGCGVRVAVV